MLKPILLLFTIFILFTCVHQTPEKNMEKITSKQIQGQDYRLKGANVFEYSKHTLKSASGCTLHYTEFKPVDVPVNDNVIILGHGFFRNEKTQKELAEHFASWGLHTVTVGFCNSKPWNGHHDKNGADMVLVANAIGAKSVIYSGFSAGGLAAIIASSEDSRTKAYLGLDMVDNFDKGIKAAPAIKAPVFGLVAEPSMCNAKNNGLKVYAEIDQPNLVKIKGARHCDFEYPFDKKCSLACGKTHAPYEREDVQDTILGLSTSLLLWQSGLDQSAKSWWEKGQDNSKLFIKNSRTEIIQN